MHGGQIPVTMAAMIAAHISVLLGACSTSDARVGDESGDAGAGDDAASQDAGPWLDVIGVEGGGPGCSCSADLRVVLDCGGQPIAKCSPDEGCVGGRCVPDPCEAARQSKSSYGCEFYAMNLDSIELASGGCYAMFVANTWDRPVHIYLDRDQEKFRTGQFARIPSGQGSELKYAPYDADVGLPPGEVAILFLAIGPTRAATCPREVTPAVLADTAVHGTGRGQAFHVTTDAPVVAYQIYPYGGGDAALTSATLLLPTSVWDVNYVAVNAFPQAQAFDRMFGEGNPSLDIVAGTDDTHVTIGPVVAIAPGKDVAGSPANTPVTYTLDRGEYLQISQAYELTGSAILADKPIGLFGGSLCLNVPVDVEYCDSAQQQIPPVKAMGSEYVAVRYRGRGGADESVPWRLVGAVDGTTLSYDPAPPTGAPTALNRGQVAAFSGPGPFVVRSQDSDHPFYAAAYMTGGALFDDEGDAEWVNIVPSAQYLASYVFFTDPTYSETELVVVRKSGGADVTLDCLGAVGSWQKVGGYDYARVDLVTGNFRNVGDCSNGRHVMSSSTPFGVTVWGWGSKATGGGVEEGFYTQDVSYAYPAGASVQPVNAVVVPPTIR